ncbi:MAG: SNG1 family protein [Nocardiaceae bacterium]|nr:SNG1 family protein [Nocardiaceae bacterium]
MTEVASTRASVRRIVIPPIIIVSLLMTLLAFMYLGSVLDPQKNLHDFSVAIVNQDDGDPASGNLGQVIVDQIDAKIDHSQFDVRRIKANEMQRQFRNGELYGAIVIPSDFSKRMTILGQSAVVPAEKIERPLITIYTNPRLGAFAAGIVNTMGDRVLAEVNKASGKELTDKVLAAAPGAPIPGASFVALANPVDTVRVPYNPLPPGTGNGLSAFYYAMLLLLAGFTGSMIIHGIVDSRFGFAPTEFGPLFVHSDRVGISRFKTLLVKWAVIATMAPIVSAIYLGVARVLGAPLDKPLLLFLYGTFAIFAVGVTATSILATIGTMGLLVNIAFFVILGVPSAGGTLPIQATPKLYEWLSQFEPMRQVYLGCRSILYFNGHADAGLGQSFWMTAIGLAFGLILGTAVTTFYDRKGLSREPGGIDIEQMKEAQVEKARAKAEFKAKKADSKHRA